MSEIKLAVCARLDCRSTEVELTSVANWDIDKQKWVKNTYHSGSYCFSCDTRDYGIELMTEEELKAEQADEENSDSR